jgi:hypothetical protein
LQGKINILKASLVMHGVFSFKLGILAAFQQADVKSAKIISGSLGNGKSAGEVQLVEATSA